MHTVTEIEVKKGNDIEIESRFSNSSVSYNVLAVGYALISLAAYVPILLNEIEQEQRPSENEDREAIVVGAGLCDGEGERAYTAFAPHYDISGS